MKSKKLILSVLLATSLLMSSLSVFASAPASAPAATPAAAPAPYVPVVGTVTSTPTTIVDEGTYKVGTDIVAGTYVLLNNSKYASYYAVSTDSSGDSIVANDNFAYNSIVTVSDGQYLKLTRCTLSPILEVPTIDYTHGNVFFIGYHLPAGEYKLQSTDPKYAAYYSVSNDALQKDITSNDNFTGQTYVTVKDGQFLKITRCTFAQ